MFDVSRDLVSPVLVGRHQELGRLRSLLMQAISGEPVVALVAGEAGVGKTRLTQEVARIAWRRITGSEVGAEHAASQAAPAPTAMSA